MAEVLLAETTTMTMPSNWLANTTQAWIQTGLDCDCAVDCGSDVASHGANNGSGHVNNNNGYCTGINSKDKNHDGGIDVDNTHNTTQSGVSYPTTQVSDAKNQVWSSYVPAHPSFNLTAREDSKHPPQGINLAREHAWLINKPPVYYPNHPVLTDDETSPPMTARYKPKSAWSVGDLGYFQSASPSDPTATRLCQITILELPNHFDPRVKIDCGGVEHCMRIDDAAFSPHPNQRVLRKYWKGANV